MTKKWFGIVLVIGASIVGAAINRASTTPLTRQPTVVATMNQRGITQGIPQTMLFTPSATGVFRASTYLGVTTPVTGGNVWEADLNWTDDAGVEEATLSIVSDNFIPPHDWGSVGVLGVNPTFVFEAVAGHPVSFTLQQSLDNPPGAVGLTITIERLQ